MWQVKKLEDKITEGQDQLAFIKILYIFLFVSNIFSKSAKKLNTTNL